MTVCLRCGNTLMEMWNGKDWIYHCYGCEYERDLTEKECLLMLGLIDGVIE